MFGADNKNVQASRPFTRSEYALLLFVALVYVALIGRYRAYDLDDVWFLSFSHSFWAEHVSTDTFMLMVFPEGMGGVVAFGKLAAIVQGVTLSLFGWTLVAGTALSIFFVLVSLILLVDMCRRLACPPHFSLCFTALLGLTEPFVFVSQKTRYEFLAVFCLSLALWLVERGWVGFAIFVAGLAMEIEPAAIVIPCAVLVAVLLKTRGNPAFSKTVPRAAVGAAFAVVTYFLLHPHILAVVRSANWGAVSAGSFPGGFVTVYYLHYRRHLFDLALLLAALVVACSRCKRHLLVGWPAMCALTILVVSTLLRWGNVPYFSFISPFLCLFILQVLYTERYWRLILAGILLWTIPQYGFRYHFWAVRDAGFSQRDEQQVESAIQRSAALIGKPASQVRIAGNFNLWYAHPDHFINLDRRLSVSLARNRPDLLLCFNQPVDPILTAAENEEVVCPELKDVSIPWETMTLHGHTLEIRVLNPLR